MVRVAMLMLRAALYLSCLPLVLGNVKLGKHIVKYTEEKLHYVLNQAERPPIFLEIFSPTCPACQSLAPRLSQAAAQLKDQAPEMKVVALDGTQAENTMKSLGAAEFPALFFLSQSNKTYRLQLNLADSSDAITRWVLRTAAPAVKRLAHGEDPPAVKDSPQLLLRAAELVPAFQSLAEERKMDFEAYWMPTSDEEKVSSVSSIRHAGQPDVNFTWSHLTVDSLDDEGERFEDFVKDNMLPAVILVKDPKKAMKLIESQDAVLLWMVLNSSAEVCEETCSATHAAVPALEDTIRPWRSFLEETRDLYQATIESSTSRTPKNLLILAVDIQQFPSFVEQELYAWSAGVVAQRFRHGPRYFFSDIPGAMPERPADLSDFLKTLLKRSPRQMSERPDLPRDWPRFWEKLVNMGLEEKLRSNNATLLYTFKSPDKISNDEEVIDFEDEMEALDAMAEWLNKSCERPPPVAALDVRKNEVPLSLYAAASIGGLNAPGLYFIESDVGKASLGIRWAGNIAELEKPESSSRTDLTSERRSVLLSGHLHRVIPWILEHSRPLKAFQVPSDYVAGDGSVFQQKASAVLDLDSEKDLQKLLERKVTGLMEFYSPSCGACKKFAPSFESAASKGSSNFTFARMDCSTVEGERSCNRHGIDKYPSVFYMVDGRLETYTGGPGRNQLLEFLHLHSSPLFLDVASEEEAKALAASKPILFWGAKNFTLMEEVAQSFRQQVKVARWKMPVDGNETLRLLWPLKSVGKVDVEYLGHHTQEELGLWLAEQLVRSAPIPTADPTSPVVTVVGANFRKTIFEPLAHGPAFPNVSISGRQHVMLEVYAPWCGHCKKLAPIYEAFAQKMQDEGRDLVVAKMDGEANGIPFDGFDYTGFPTIFYLNPQSSQIKKVQARTLDSLEDFVRQMRVPRGKAEEEKPSLDTLLSQFRSEEAPSPQTHPVLTVVLRNFIDVVFHQSRNCILMIHDTKCPHCKQMMPAFEAFAQELTDDVFLAKMDGKANDLPVKGFDVEGFPTLFFIEAGSKEPTFKQIGSNALHAMRRFMEPP
eukprot:symbB.v1.2.017236.t1/scaffold1342.1/size124297/9